MSGGKTREDIAEQRRLDADLNNRSAATAGNLLSNLPLALIGGVGTVIGPLIGAVTYLALEELFWRNVLEFHAGLLGLVVVGLVLFLPKGLAGLRGFGLAQWPFRRRARLRSAG